MGCAGGSLHLGRRVSFRVTLEVGCAGGCLEMGRLGHGRLSLDEMFDRV